MTKNGVRQLAGLALDGHLPLLHRFQQRALGLGRGAVDLVGQDQLGEDRAGMKHEGFALAFVDGRAKDVGRQQVAGELNALVLQAQTAGQGVGQGGFAHARQVLDQQVAARQQATHGQADGVFLAENGGANLADHQIQSIFESGHRLSPVGADRA